MADCPTLGGNIRQARLALDMSQRQLARLVGMSHVMLGRYEKNRADVKARRLALIAQALDTTVERLLPSPSSSDPGGRPA